MKMYLTGGVCENEFCKKCSHKEDAYCKKHEIGLVKVNGYVPIPNRHIIENCSEPWKNGLWEVMSMLRSYAQEPDEIELGPDEDANGNLDYICSKLTVGMVMTIVSEVEPLGLFDDGELDKFMETER